MCVQLRAYRQVRPLPGVFCLHLAQQSLQVRAQLGLQLWFWDILQGSLQCGPQGVDVSLRYQGVSVPALHMALRAKQTRESAVSVLPGPVAQGKEILLSPAA